MHPSRELEMLIRQRLSASVSVEGKGEMKSGKVGGSFIANTEEIHCRAAQEEGSGH